MFQIGDKILYGNSGACLIEKIELMRFGRSREQYYILRPLYQNAAVIYVPVNNAQLVSKIREMPTKEAVEQMISRITEISADWIEDAQERKATFDDMLRNGDCIDRIRMVKVLRTYKQQRLAAGKNLHVSDDNFLREAFKLLCDEFAYPLQLSPAEVSELIRPKFEA